MLANNTLVSLRDVGVNIHGNWLIQHISLDIHAYDVLSLIGVNGAGKSTLIKALLGLLPLTTGTIQRAPKLVIGYVPQKFTTPNTLPLSVHDLLAQRLPKRLAHPQIQAVIDSLYLDSLLTKQVSALSGGELQRVLLGKALLDKPDLLVLDEPMQGLDPEAQTLLYALIDSLPAFLRCAMLIVSHDLHWVMKGTKHVICLNKHICCQGMPADIALTPEFIALFGHYGAPKHTTPYIHRPHHCTHALTGQFS